MKLIPTKAKLQNCPIHKRMKLKDAISRLWRAKKVQEIGFSTVRMKLATKDNKIAPAASHMTIKHTDSYL